MWPNFHTGDSGNTVSQEFQVEAVWSQRCSSRLFVSTLLTTGVIQFCSIGDACNVLKSLPAVSQLTSSSTVSSSVSFLRASSKCWICWSLIPHTMQSWTSWSTNVTGNSHSAANARSCDMYVITNSFGPLTRVLNLYLCKITGLGLQFH